MHSMFTQMPKVCRIFSFQYIFHWKPTFSPRTVKSNPLTEFEKPGMSWIDKFIISPAFLTSYLNLYFLKSKIIGLTYCKRSIIELLKKYLGMFFELSFTNESSENYFNVCLKNNFLFTVFHLQYNTFTHIYIHKLTIRGY